jgi:hypothetical protein
MARFRHTTVCLALLLAPAAFAQTYIAPEGECGQVTLHVMRGSDFSNAGETIAANRVAEAIVFSQRKKSEVIPAQQGGSLSFTADVPQEEAVVMTAVRLKPVVSGNETRTEQAKAMTFCGATPRADWQRSTGLSLEIYPQGWNGPRPRMKRGEPMRFIAVDKATNKLLADLPMELYRAGSGRIAEGKPAQYGGMTFPYPEPGRYVVVATYGRADPQDSGHWLVDTSTLTFDVK